MLILSQISVSRLPPSFGIATWRVSQRTGEEKQHQPWTPSSLTSLNLSFHAESRGRVGACREWWLPLCRDVIAASPHKPLPCSPLPHLPSGTLKTKTHRKSQWQNYIFLSARGCLPCSDLHSLLLFSTPVMRKLKKWFPWIPWKYYSLREGERESVCEWLCSWEVHTAECMSKLDFTFHSKTLNIYICWTTKKMKAKICWK